jgi:hypothetical protein
MLSSEFYLFDDADFVKIENKKICYLDFILMRSNSFTYTILSF